MVLSLARRPPTWRIPQTDINIKARGGKRHEVARRPGHITHTPDPALQFNVNTGTSLIRHRQYLPRIKAHHKTLTARLYDSLLANPQLQECARACVNRMTGNPVALARVQHRASDCHRVLDLVISFNVDADRATTGQRHNTIGS
jgi:hypothetical protein